MAAIEYMTDGEVQFNVVTKKNPIFQHIRGYDTEKGIKVSMKMH